MKITPMAKRSWDKIPAEFKMKILNNVWCSTCRTAVNIDAKKMSIDKGMLVIEGVCMVCSEPVCRVVEEG